MVTTPSVPTAAAGRPRCPRCGATMGVLTPTEGQAPEQTSPEFYCGCCGLVIAPVDPAGR
jgi:hypothetical protein